MAILEENNIPSYLVNLWPMIVELQDSISVVYAGRNNGSVLYLPEEELINTINNSLVDKDILVLDNAHETFIPSEVNRIYSVLSQLNVSANNIYYLTNSSDAVCIHDMFCEQNNYTDKINIVVLNTFEYVKRDLFNVSSLNYTVGERQRKFICMNRMPHLHRTCLLGLMLEHNLVDQSYYSFYDTEVCISDTTLNNIKEKFSLSVADTIISNVNNFHSSLPLRLTLDNDANNPNDLTALDAVMFNNSYFSVVPETYFFKNSFLNEMNTVFMTEKTYNAILMNHPFIIVGMPHSLDHLHHNGYKTFHPYIDESYDDVHNDEERLLMIIDEVKRLSSLNTDQLLEWQQNIKEIVEYNYQVLMNRHAGPLNGITLRKNNNE